MWIRGLKLSCLRQGSLYSFTFDERQTFKMFQKGLTYLLVSGRLDFFLQNTSVSRIHIDALFIVRNIYARGPLMVAQWLRYSATNRKVAGSIPDGVIGIFH
jgi:hypothetical protein